MTIALVDNGSLAPEAHRRLRSLAASLSSRCGVEVHAVSLKHSDRIPPEKLDGPPARVLRGFVAGQLAQGRSRFLFVPYFISASGAIGSSLRRSLEEARDLGEFSYSFAPGLERPVVAQAAAEQVLGVMRREGLERAPVIVVDHGGPSRESAMLRDALASDVRGLLGSAASVLRAASMEAPELPGYEFSLPLFSDVLGSEGFDSGPVVVSPLFLAPGRHAGPGGDLERIARRIEAQRPGLRCVFADLIGAHPPVAEALAAALRGCLAKEAEL